MIIYLQFMIGVFYKIEDKNGHNYLIYRYNKQKYLLTMTRIIQTFTDFGNRKWKEKLDGGKADGMSPEDFESDDIKIGTKVEREHSSNPDIATEIAMDHLVEDPDYYDKLIASGIADEEDAVNLWDELKSDSDKEKAESDILSAFDSDDVEEEDVEEDELGTDKVDFDDDEQIFDEEEPKNKIKVMEEKKNLKNYMSFLLKETVKPEEAPEPVNDPGPERKYSKENKYKFQLPYEKKIVDKLNEYNFSYYVPDGEKEVGKPSPSTHFIIIDILNLTYSVVGEQNPDVKTTDQSKLKNILENL